MPRRSHNVACFIIVYEPNNSGLRSRIHGFACYMNLINTSWYEDEPSCRLGFLIALNSKASVLFKKRCRK